MRLIKQKDSWSCGVCSWATVLRFKKDEILKMLPKKLRKINEYGEAYPELGAPGVPMAAFIPIAHRYNKGVALHFISGLPIPKVKQIIKSKEGVLVHSAAEQYLHAVAWDGEKILDSASGIKTIDELEEDENPLEQFYEVYPLKGRMK